MSLKSHTLTRQDDGTTNLKTFTLTNGDNVQTLTVRHDFTRPDGDTQSLTVGSLILLLDAVLSDQFDVPETHAVLWRQIRQNTRLSAEAYAYSEALRALETTDPATLGFRLELGDAAYSRDVLALPPTTLLYRLRRMNHVHRLEDGVLVVHLYDDLAPGTDIEQWIDDLLDVDGAYQLVVYEDDTPVVEHAFLRCEYPDVDILLDDLVGLGLTTTYDAQTRRIEAVLQDPTRGYTDLATYLNARS